MWVLGAATLWGTLGVASVALFRMGLSPWDVSFWRTALSAVGIALWALLAKRELLRVPEGPMLGRLVLFGAVGVGLFFVSFQLANHLTSVAVAVILLYLAPLFVMAGGHLLLGERLTRAKIAMAALVVAGVWATTLGASQAEVRVHPWGVVWGVVSALAYSSYYFFGRRYVPSIGVARTLLFSLAVGTVFVGAAAWLVGQPPRVSLPWEAWALLLWIAVGGTLLANVLYYRGLASMEAGRAATVAALEPVIASLLAFAVLGQELTVIGWLGVALVVVGVSVAARMGSAQAAEARSR